MSDISYINDNAWVAAYTSGAFDDVADPAPAPPPAPVVVDDSNHGDY